jgi:SNF family Na+-dependent transporter
MSSTTRDSWGSRLAVVLAVAGSAIGLGNFLRFPSVAVNNGGGAFMIPYLAAFVLLGIPMMLVEWTLGRYGGGFGHGTAPGIFHSVWRKNRFIKYFGIIGIFGPLVIFMYYTYIASWTLGYSVFSLASASGAPEAPAAAAAFPGRQYAAVTNQAQMGAFLAGYQGAPDNPYFNGLGWAYVFFLITFAVNVGVLAYGIRGGIARLCRVSMPILFLCALALLTRVLTLPPAEDGTTVAQGFNYLWKPDFSTLLSGKVWLAAAGQIFFTLSVGIGVILTYASYLKKADDVALSGLSAAATNETAEVVLGGSILIPAAFLLLGQAQMQDVAKAGTFNLGFVIMPLILKQIPLAPLFGFLWFLLLFLAAITSSVSLAQPVVAFLEDEFDIPRRRAVAIFAAVAFLLCQPAIFLLRQGVVDELDFWGGNVFLVIFALVEVLLFGWVFGMDKAWAEIHHGSSLTVPRAYKFIIKYVTPAFLLVILTAWLWQDWRGVILLEHLNTRAAKAYALGTRAGLLAILAVLAVLVKLAWRRKARPTAPEATP